MCERTLTSLLVFSSLVGRYFAFNFKPEPLMITYPQWEVTCLLLKRWYQNSIKVSNLSSFLCTVVRFSYRIVKEKMPKSDQCFEGFVNYQKCHYNNCSLSRTTSNVWEDRYLSVQIDKSDNTKWAVVNNRECVNPFGIPLPISHCYGCQLEPELEPAWQLEKDFWADARDLCLSKRAGWRLFDHFDGKYEHLIVDLFNAFRADVVFEAIGSNLWVGVYKDNGKFNAASDETRVMSIFQTV